MKYFSFFLFVFISVVSQAQDWNNVNIGTTKDLNAVHFIDNNTGFILGDSGTLFRTADGGANWTVINTGVTHDLNDVSFANANLGFINGLKTTNGGLNWTVQPASDNYVLMKALDTQNILAGDGLSFNGAVLKSTDGGSSYQSIASPITTGFYTDEFFISNMVGFMCSWYGGHLIKTTNGGTTWTEITNNLGAPNNIINGIYGVTFPSVNIGVVATNDAIYKTTDGGSTWPTVFQTAANDIQFSSYGIVANSDLNYIVVGGHPVDSTETIYETKDGGANWTFVNNSNKQLEDIACTASDCYAVGAKGTVLKKARTPLSNTDISLELTEVKLYPNPVSDYIQIQKAGVTIDAVQVLDIYSKVVMGESKPSLRLYVGDLSEGIYFVKIYAEGSEQVLKFVKH